MDTTCVPRAFLAALCLCFVTACAASTAPKELNTDIMTASGRLELPPASPDGSLYQAVEVSDYSIETGVTQLIALEANGSDARLAESLSRSLSNHDFLAGEDNRGHGVSASVQSVAFEPHDEGEFVIVTTRFATSSDEPSLAVSCLDQTITARWLLLDPINSGTARRVTSTGSAIALAFVGIDASNLVTVQFADTAAHNQAVNREFGERTGASVGLRGDLEGSRRIGFQNAIRLAHATYIDQLGFCEAQLRDAPAAAE